MDESIFSKYYQPQLERCQISNIVFRVYEHLVGSIRLRGVLDDNPDGGSSLVFSTLADAPRILTDLVNTHHPRKGVALASMVSIGTELKNLIFIDCELPVSATNEQMLVESLKDSMNLLPSLNGGMLLRTQNSYHIAGFQPLNESEWTKSIASSLLLMTKDGQRIAEPSGIARSLIRGYGSLRLNAYRGKHVPEFITYI